MKRKLSVVLIAGISVLLVGCTEDYPTYGNEEEFAVSQSIEVVAEEVLVTDDPIAEPIAEPVVIAPVAEITPGPVPIDTQVFEYARKVEVLDARELTDHLTVTVWMGLGMTQGQAADYVVKQAFYFIQQDDVVGAETITIGVMHGDTRVFQFTVNVAQFEESADGTFVDDVLAASTVDKISVEVAKFAEAFEWRMNR